MRHIKFRVWHKVEKRWLDPWAEEDPVLSLKDFGEGCEVFIYERDSGDWSNQNCLMKDVVIQQYTGLKDKNGCEIYEGDILLWEEGWMYPEMNGEIQWIENGYYFVQPEYSVKWLVTQKSLSTKTEIIGNTNVQDRRS